MSFISVVPAVRTPFGVDCFDYRIPDDADIRIGDLLRVPFRKTATLALVCDRRDTSPFAEKTIALTPERLIALGPDTVVLLSATARRTFCSRPTILASWLRTPPARLAPVANASFHDQNVPPAHSVDYFTTARVQSIVQTARQSFGKVLLITPWQHRADAFAALLRTTALHADLANGAAWRTWTSFVSSDASLLVTTRIGAWLSAIADTVILDEPENDDHKQDELAPRFDARWMTEEAARERSHLTLIRIGTTPPLHIQTQPAPSIDPPLVLEPWQSGSRTDLPGISSAAQAEMESALEDHRPVIILHPIKGERGRIHCRDCSWTMNCAACGFALTSERDRARCHRCGCATDLPITCPSCGGADLAASRVGKNKLASLVASRYGASVVVADLPEWHRLRVPPRPFILLTDLSLVGGHAEDIRRKERLIIAWRRLAASVQQTGGSLYVLGPESLLTEARGWLHEDGFARAWKQEYADRSAFRYPPAHPRIKLLVDGDESIAQQVHERATTLLDSTWTIEGPFPVAYRATTRKPRHILHLIPPASLDPRSLYALLEPLAKDVMIDLDPIAFFS